LNQTEVHKSRKAYLGAVKFIDDEVGKIIQALKDKGVYDNTIILFTSDHGDM
jgi:arylsulfatase A-like enzyme